jgi:RND superfamily putative drug exporter
MFEKLGHLVVRRRKSMLAFFIIGILTAGTVGSLVFSRLDSGGYSDPNSDSYQVYNYLHDTLKIADPNVVVVVDSGDSPINDPAIAAKARLLEAEMAKVSGVTKTLSYWSTGGEKTLAAKDGKAAYILVYSKAEAKEVGNKVAGKMKMMKKAESGAEVKKTNRGGVMLLAKKIRKEGESWKDALKRAGQQLK